MTREFGLIGFPLTHSFSKRYFTDKFNNEGINDCKYELYPIENVNLMPKLFEEHPNLVGLNVTIPYKQEVIPLLDNLDPSALKIGAVNVIKKTKEYGLIGYNSDYFGFRNSLEEFLNGYLPENALILGTGGAAKAVKVCLDDMGIASQYISRKSSSIAISYAELTSEIIQNHTLIVNCSPTGTFPNINECPDIPYQSLTSKHYLYDLVYNPPQTMFMKKGDEQGCKTINGLAMLIGQAEKAWEIWNS